MRTRRSSWIAGMSMVLERVRRRRRRKVPLAEANCGGKMGVVFVWRRWGG